MAEKGNQASPGKQAPPELINQLKNRDSSIRQNAAETIGIMRDEKAVDSLITILKDNDRFVRQEAVIRSLSAKYIISPFLRVSC